MNGTSHRSETRQPTSLQEILGKMSESGDFQAVILASKDGLPVATEPADYDSEIAAAAVALLRKVSSEAQQQVGLAALDEVTIRSSDHVRLACRYLDVGEQGLILVALVPPGHHYRRATSRAIRQIRQLLA
ncbi:MAG: roadblock/LC7 domain-containing protein [Anaerolineae bacterium]|nr:roadblock/LC7 domain-containing protein [Anaerolineae bacterium]